MKLFAPLIAASMVVAAPALADTAPRARSMTLPLCSVRVLPMARAQGWALTPPGIVDVHFDPRGMVIYAKKHGHTSLRIDHADGSSQLYDLRVR